VSSGAAQALLGYVADRLNVPAGGLTRGEAVEQLRRAGVHDEAVDALDELLRVCEAAEFGGADASAGDVRKRARAIIARLERSRF
jgi:hypothetical protein